MDIFVLNKDIIILKFICDEYLYFWKINEDNTLTRVFKINVGYGGKSLLKYDNILFIKYYNSIQFMNLDNYQVIKQIDNLNDICCITKLLNGNILLGLSGEKGYDIVEYKYNKITYDLTKLNFIYNAYFAKITNLIEMENGNIISYKKENDYIIIWNRSEDLK